MRGRPRPRCGVGPRSCMPPSALRCCGPSSRHPPHSSSVPRHTVCGSLPGILCAPLLTLAQMQHRSLTLRLSLRYKEDTAIPSRGRARGAGGLSDCAADREALWVRRSHACGRPGDDRLGPCAGELPTPSGMSRPRGARPKQKSVQRTLVVGPLLCSGAAPQFRGSRVAPYMRSSPARRRLRPLLRALARVPCLCLLARGARSSRCTMSSRELAPAPVLVSEGACHAARMRFSA
jgi:hypothetical protein